MPSHDDNGIDDFQGGYRRSDKGRRRNDGERRGRGGKGGRVGGEREIVVSKAISWILRHGAQKEGLRLDGMGYADVGELLSWHKLRSLNVTFQELRTIVSTNDKQRFSLIPRPTTTPSTKVTSQDSSSSVNTTPPPHSSSPSDFLIRANQGHSLPISSSALLLPMLIGEEGFTERVVHGTDLKAWKAILASGGLKRMGRVHIHFATGVPDPRPSTKGSNRRTTKSREQAESLEQKEGIDVGVGGEKVISGMRAAATVLIWVDVSRSIEEGGLKWWRSANGVVLTEGDELGLVGLRWINRVEGRKGGEVIWEPEKGREGPEEGGGEKVDG